MRVVATILYLVVLAICGLGIHGASPPDYPSISLNLTVYPLDSYRNFLVELRERVTQGANTALDLPVLKPKSEVSVQTRFVLVPLTIPSSHTVTFAIDVVNFYVVAFSANGMSYFFSDSSAVQRDNLFVDTTQENLGYTGNYTSLEDQANVGREYIFLGPGSLAEAISSLWRETTTGGENVARALLVVIQMVSEAARFRYIESRIEKSLTDVMEFEPDPLMLSMENNWSSMSLEIQRALPGGTFAQVVQLRDQDNNPIDVANFRTLFQLTYIAVLVYRCPPAANAQIIKMPVFRVGEDKETCPLVVEVTRRISGWDGLCVDVRDGLDNDGNPIQLRSCGQESSQQWTFRRDQTIRSMGKCLTTYGYSHGDYVMIYNCDTAVPDATKWVLSIDGTITNPHSGLVLTAREDGQETALYVDNNIHAARQGWIVGNVEPLVTFIVGYNQMCFTQNNHVSLENCELYRLDQKWALYGDGTIRVNSDRSLCVTSDGHSSGDVIIILECQGRPNQRWVFNTNGTISNPNAKLVMQAKQGVALPPEIVLYQPTGLLDQQWITHTHPAE